MARSLKKNPFVSHKLLKKKKKFIKTWSRSSNIIPTMIGQTIAVYNGREHIPLFITSYLIGHKLGEFSPTINFRGHTKLKGDNKSSHKKFYGTKN
uniref:Small ribosomal subunit protein uS19c n=1 Tax=Mitrastemon kanehirai TaxID=1358725 RepID=A0A4Y1MCV6_9ERIC|nr:ribosomal protein S19 [Mitrastemon kanehirai]